MAMPLGAHRDLVALWCCGWRRRYRRGGRIGERARLGDRSIVSRAGQRGGIFEDAEGGAAGLDKSVISLAGRLIEVRGIITAQVELDARLGPRCGHREVMPPAEASSNILLWMVAL